MMYLMYIVHSYNIFRCCPWLTRKKKTKGSSLMAAGLMYSSYLDIANRCALQTLNYFVSQGGITCSCGAIDQASRSSKDIKKRVIINFCDKNVLIAHFRDKNGGFILLIYICIYVYIFYLSSIYF